MNLSCQPKGCLSPHIWQPRRRVTSWSPQMWAKQLLIDRAPGSRLCSEASFEKFLQAQQGGNLPRQPLENTSIFKRSGTCGLGVGWPCCSSNCHFHVGGWEEGWYNLLGKPRGSMSQDSQNIHILCPRNLTPRVYQEETTKDQHSHQRSFSFHCLDKWRKKQTTWRSNHRGIIQEHVACPHEMAKLTMRYTHSRGCKHKSNSRKVYEHSDCGYHW